MAENVQWTEITGVTDFTRGWGWKDKGSKPERKMEIRKDLEIQEDCKLHPEPQTRTLKALYKSHISSNTYFALLFLKVQSH